MNFLFSYGERVWRRPFLAIAIVCAASRCQANDKDAASSVRAIVKRDNAMIHAGPSGESPVVRGSRASLMVSIREKKGAWIRIHDGWIAASDVIEAKHALEHFSALIESGGSGLAFACRARAYLILERADEGFADAERAVALDRTHAPGWYILGSARRIRGDLAGAEAACREAIRLAPDFGAAHGGLGFIMYLQQRYDDAIAEFNDAIAHGDGDATTFGRRGACYLKTENWRRTVQDVTRAIELGCRESNAYVCRAAAYGSLRSYDRALADASRAIELNGSSAQAFALRGEIRGEMGGQESALRDFAQAMELDPKLAMPFVMRAALHANAGRLDEALADVESALRLSPADSDALKVHGVLLLLRGDAHQGLDALTKSVTLNPRSGEAHARRGEALAYLGDYPAAAKELAEAMRINPLSFTANCIRARVLSQCPDPSVRDGQQALVCAKSACEITKYENSGALQALASAYAELSDFESALRYLNDALRVGPKDDDFIRRAEAQRAAYKEKRPWRYAPPSPRRL